MQRTRRLAIDVYAENRRRMSWVALEITPTRGRRSGFRSFLPSRPERRTATCVSYQEQEKRSGRKRGSHRSCALPGLPVICYQASGWINHVKLALAPTAPTLARASLDDRRVAAGLPGGWTGQPDGLGAPLPPPPLGSPLANGGDRSPRPLRRLQPRPLLDGHPSPRDDHDLHR